jgi:hypothetical protein
LQELRSLVSDAGQTIQEDIDRLQRDLLPKDDPDVVSKGPLPGRFGRHIR